jgi:RNA recognition motif-containing protein
MATDEGATAAIAALSGHSMDGRALTVNLAKPRAETDRGNGGGRRSSGNW